MVTRCYLALVGLFFLRHCSLGYAISTLRPIREVERGVPMEQLQKFARHAKLETTQGSAESTPEIM